MNEKKFTIRLSQKTYSNLKDRAVEQNLSMNALINVALNDFIEKWFKAEMDWGDEIVKRLNERAQKD